MEIKYRFFWIILMFLLLAGHFSPNSLYAQIGASSGYFIDPGSEPDDPRFIQRLVWSGGDYALYYEVFIERRTSGVFISHLRRNTEELFIDVSLPPGEYRFRVVPYDILERPGQSSAWIEFEILPALMPVLEAALQVSDEVSGYDDHQSNVIIIQGSNLIPGAEIILRNDDNNYFTPDSVEFHDDGNIELFFDENNLPEGEYEIVIRNPGGLEARMGGVNIVFAEPASEPEIENEAESIAEIEPEIELEIEYTAEHETETDIFDKSQALVNIAFNFMPFFHTYGDSIGNSSNSSSLSFNLNLLFPVSSVYFGPEFSVIYNFNYLNGGYASIGFSLNLLFHKQINNITALNFRFGTELYSAAEQTVSILNTGLSAYFKLNSLLFIETGIIFSNLHFFDDNNYSGFIRPMVSIGLNL